MKKTKKRTLNIALIAALAILAAVSFGPCLLRTSYGMIANSGHSEYVSYFPKAFCVVSVVEIILVVVSGRRFVRLIGLLLHLVKTVGPFFVSSYLGNAIADKTVRYSFTWLGLILIGISVGVAGLYLYDLYNE